MAVSVTGPMAKLGSPVMPGTQLTESICITFVQRRPNVFDVGPTLYKCYTNALCLLVVDPVVGGGVWCCGWGGGILSVISGMALETEF